MVEMKETRRAEIERRILEVFNGLPGPCTEEELTRHCIAAGIWTEKEKHAMFREEAEIEILTELLEHFVEDPESDTTTKGDS